jgi:hypothetical protein
MVTRSESESAETWLVNLPISPRQSRISFLVAVVLIAGLGATAPFADVQLPRIDAFIPAAEIAVIITDFITAALLFSQARIYHSRAVLALASGYLFTANCYSTRAHISRRLHPDRASSCRPPNRRLALYLLAFCFSDQHAGLCTPERRKIYRTSHTGLRLCSSLGRRNRNYLCFWVSMAGDRWRSIPATRVFRCYPPDSFFSLYPYIRGFNLCDRVCVGVVAEATLGT